jgi:hypothetical protein
MATSMEGEPIHRMNAMYHTPVPTKPPSSLSPLRPRNGLPLLEAQAGEGPVEGGRGASAPLPSPTRLSAIAGQKSDPLSPKRAPGTPATESASSSATTTETISDSNGNPILFLATSRYKNEFREQSQLGKGGERPCWRTYAFVRRL